MTKTSTGPRFHNYSVWYSFSYYCYHPFYYYPIDYCTTCYDKCAELVSVHVHLFTLLSYLKICKYDIWKYQVLLSLLLCC